MGLMPLGLEAQVSSPSGGESTTIFEYSTDAAKLGSFGPITTKANTGHEAASVDTYRDQRLSYGSPRLLQELKIKGAGGWSLHEGRVTGVPVGRNDNVSSTGWWDGLKDTSGVAEVYSGKDVGKWGGIPLNMQANWVTNNYNPEDGTIAGGGIQTKIAQPPWTSPGLPASESWYTAPPGVNLASITGTWTRSGGVGTGASAHTWEARLSTDDAVASYDTTGDLEAAGPATFSLSATVTGRRYAILNYYYSTTYATADSTARAINWTDVTVKGDHGLTNIYASEVIKHAIGKYCPLLTATSSTIDDTTYAIGQLEFDGATVADVVQRVNAFHLWRFMVWDDRKCYFSAPRDLTDYDYEIPFQGEYRGTLDPAGPSLDDDEPCNGVWVYYTDVQTGRKERVGPYGTSSPYDTAGDSSLLVTSEINACNIEGQTRFPSLDISFNCTRADAILMGSVWLAEKQTKVNAGTGTANGYVKNRAGAWVPAYQIRAGDRVRYSHEINTIREVYSTSYDPSTFINSLTFEKPDASYDGMNERAQVALQAALGGS